VSNSRERHELLSLQVAKEAKRVVARLDAAEQQSQRIHSADPARQKLADLYSLGHKASRASPDELATAWDVALLHK
jgi:hypothetical protein